MDKNLTIGEMEDNYKKNQSVLLSLKKAYEKEDSAFYGPENEPEKIEGVGIQADGTAVAWCGKYARYFSINPVKITTSGKLWISDFSCGGAAVGLLDVDSINKYNATVSESRKIVDWINF